MTQLLTKFKSETQTIQIQKYLHYEERNRPFSQATEIYIVRMLMNLNEYS